MKQSDVYEYLSVRLRMIFAKFPQTIRINEIRLRIGQPVIVETDVGEMFVSETGQPALIGQAYRVCERDIRETLEYISNYSLYAYEEELKNGYITIPGGNRIGICGKTVVDIKGIKTMRNIGSVNIRMAHEISGCSDCYMEKLYENNDICNTMIISPPCSGKTTMLRDIARNISNGFSSHNGQCVGIVDERSEIAACCYGVPQNNVGIRTDVMDCCPKSYGMIMLIRSMAPKVIAVDEIGSREDVDALEYCVNCGSRMLVTIHGSSVKEIMDKKVMERLFEKNIFKRFIVLSGNPQKGTVVGIYNERGEFV